jgi:hypothetical protein
MERAMRDFGDNFHSRVFANLLTRPLLHVQDRRRLSLVLGLLGQSLATFVGSRSQ